MEKVKICVSSRRAKSTRKRENDESACLTEERKTRGNRKSENPRVRKRKKKHAEREKQKNGVFMQPKIDTRN